MNHDYIWLFNSPKGKFQDENMRTRPKGSGTISALVSNAMCGNLAYQPHDKDREEEEK